MITRSVALPAWRPLSRGEHVLVIGRPLCLTIHGVRNLTESEMKRAVVTLVLGWLVSASPWAAPPSVFKCAGPNGSVVFSQTPCGKDARQVDTSRALRAGTSPNVQGVSDYAALGRIDSDCRLESEQMARWYAAEIASVDSEIARVKASMRYSSNNLAGATRDNGLQTQLASLTERISAVQAMERSDTADLRQRCDERRAAERNAQAERDALSRDPDAREAPSDAAVDAPRQ
jgi:hypothetical protein